MTDPQQVGGQSQKSVGEVSQDGKTSFALLVEQHHRKLYHFVYRYTHNRDDAEDLVQDTFIKAFKNFHRYDDRYAFSAWLFTIARRTVYNHYRAKRDIQTLDFELVDCSASPDTAAESDEQSCLLWGSVEKLKKKYQEVLYLKYSEDLSVEEISKVLNKTQTNIKILLFRARNQLRKIHGITSQ